jgi:hypothetical protein
MMQVEMLTEGRAPFVLLETVEILELVASWSNVCEYVVKVEWLLSLLFDAFIDEPFSPSLFLHGCAMATNELPPTHS